MPAGRPKHGDAGTLYAFAHQFYWDFRRLVEGAYRQRIDERKYERLLARAEKVPLRDDQISHIHKYVDEEIEAGRSKEADRATRLREVTETTLQATHEELRHRAAKLATVHPHMAGEPEVFDFLLQADTPEQVRDICKDAPNWPISLGSVLPLYLSKYAVEFIAARKDSRFPKSTRQSSRLKQLWFLSRTLAGAIFDYEPRTAINLVGSKRPEQIFDESRAAKPSRKQNKRRRKS